MLLSGVISSSLVSSDRDIRNMSSFLVYKSINRLTGQICRGEVTSTLITSLSLSHTQYVNRIEQHRETSEDISIIDYV